MLRRTWAIARIYLVMIGAALAANTVATVLGVPQPWWRYLVLDAIVYAALIAWWMTRHRIIAWWRWRRARNKPMVLDEDGALRVPVVGPGETVEMIVGPDGLYGARVVTAKGKVRLEQTWPMRH